MAVGTHGPKEGWGCFRVLSCLGLVWEPCCSGAHRLVRMAELGPQVPPREGADGGAPSLL